MLLGPGSLEPRFQIAAILSRSLLLQEADLTLYKADQICQIHELAESDNKAVNQDPDVNVIKQKKFFKKQTPQYRQRKCKYCDTTHKPRKCPAFGVQCNLCNKYNHFASVCMSAEQPQKRPQSQAKQQSQAKSTPSYSKFRQRRQGTQCGKRDQLHEIDYEEDDYDSSECFDQNMDSQFENVVIETLDVNQNNIKDEIHVTAVIENTPFGLKVDSGAKYKYRLYDKIRNQFSV